MKKILCPIRENLIDSPGHQIYGINYFKKITNGEVVPIIYPYKQTSYSRTEKLVLNIKIAWKALTTKHDAFYYGIDPEDNLLLLGFLKSLFIYRKPMFAWKYTVIKHTNSLFKDMILKFFYNAFNKIFMITENHVPETYAEGIVKEGKLLYVLWGEDLNFIDKLEIEKKTEFTFISTGKAHRDYDTMIKAIKKVPNARLKLYVLPNWGGQNVNLELLNNNKPENVELFIVKKRLNYKEIYLDLLQSHCALCICKPVNFGVGYTQVLDSLACGLPCILTWNKDNPIDLNSKKVGFTVPPSDVDALVVAMRKMVEDKDTYEKMSHSARKLIEEQYNIEITSKTVSRIILEEINNK